MKRSKTIKLLITAGLSIPCAFMLTACGDNDNSGSSSGGGFCQKGQCEFTTVLKASDYKSNAFWNAVSKFENKKVNGMSYMQWAGNSVYISQPINYSSSNMDQVSYQPTHIEICEKCGYIEEKEHHFETVNVVDGYNHHIRCTDCGYEHKNACDFVTSNPDGTENDGCFCGNLIPQYTVESLSPNTVKVTISEKASGEVVIPCRVGGKKVTRVSFDIPYSFSNLNITKLTIPASAIYDTSLPQNNNIEEIVISADEENLTSTDRPYLTIQNFQGLKKVTMLNGSLNEITILNCPNLTTIDTKQFAGTVEISQCTALTSVKASYFKCIDSDVSKQPQNLTEITLYQNPAYTNQYLLTYLPKFVKTINLSENVTKIESAAFRAIQNIETINAPSVTKIEEAAFQNCIALKTLNVPKVAEIEAEAFSGCTSLKSFDMPKLETIGNNAFKDCTALESANLSKVTSLGENAFYGCSKLNAVTLSNQLTVLNARTFYNCSALEEISIPASVTSFGEYLFTGCSKIKKVYYNATNATLQSAFNAPFGEIGEEVVGGCEFVVGKDVVSIPANLTYVSDSSKNNITKFTFESGSNLKTIGTRAIACLKITSLDLPQTIESVANEAIYKCEDLVTINLGSLDLSASIISGCTAYEFESYNGGYYFGTQLVGVVDGTTSLVVREGTKSALKLNDNFVSNETAAILTSITMPNTLTSWNVPFATFTNLQTIGLSDTLTEISDSMFASCENLTTVTIPESVTRIGKLAFSGCTNLQTIVLPSNLITIDEQAFYLCSNLESISIPNKVETIGAYAFQGLTKVTSFTLPDSIKTLGTSIFKNCGGESTISVTFNTLPNLKTFNTAFKGSRIETITIPNSFTKISDKEFQDCYQLKTVIFHNNIKTIGYRAFEFCKSLETITLPTNLQKIDDYAFQSCLNLKSITIPASVTSIGDYAFARCSELETITLLGSVEIPESATDKCPKYKGQEWNNGYYIGTQLVGLVNTNEGFVYIKEGTTKIASGVFTNNTSLKGVYIPESVKTIDDNEFSGCTNLTVATASSTILKEIVDGDSITYGVTKYVDELANATLDGWVYSIPTSNTTKIAGYYGVETVITIPASLGGATQITISGFEGNTSITKIDMHNNVTAISNDAFKNCTSLTEITITENVYMIGTNAFAGCTNLTKININASSVPFSVGTMTDTGFEQKATVQTTDPSFLQLLKTTYKNYTWIKGNVSFN